MLLHTADTDDERSKDPNISQLPAGYGLCLAFCTGKSFHYLAANKITACLVPEMSCALPVFHALTGRDTVSSFAGHAKKAWSTWKSLPKLTDALVMLEKRRSPIMQ